MNKVESYQCSHCTKIYISKETCRKHESRCYFNPRTQSCASCRFLKFKDYEYASGHHVALRTCLRNYDVTRKMKTRCSGFLDKKLKADKAMMKEIQGQYDPNPSIQPILDKFKTELEENIRVQRELDEKGHEIEAEALLGLLGSAIGYTIMLKQLIEFTPPDSSDDDVLEKHYEFRQYHVDVAIARFQKPGLPPERVNQIIMDMSGRFPKQIMLYAPLCRQGEITYHQQMGEYAKLYEDQESESYHQGIAIQLSESSVTGMIIKQFFAGFSMSDLRGPDCDAYSFYRKILDEAYPRLKLEIVEGLKKQTWVDIRLDCPF